MSLNKEKIIYEFKKIKEKNPHKSQFPNNRDGGAGNTLESLLGVRENNNKLPDFLNFECKATRVNSGAKISLGSKKPSFPDGASRYLWENYGDIKPPSTLRRFYPTLRANGRDSLVYKKNYMGIKVDRGSNKIRMYIMDLNKKIIKDDIFWTFEDIRESAEKLKDTMFAEITENLIDGESYFTYHNALVFWGFDYNLFLNEIENGNIELEFRCGVYKDQQRYGTMHDRGAAWRLVKRKWKETMKKITEDNIYVE